MAAQRLPPRLEVQHRRGVGVRRLGEQAGERRHGTVQITGHDLHLGLALESAETVFGVQLKTFEKNVDATTAFFGELAEARDLDGYKTLWPKGLQVAKDNAERVVAASQEVFGLSLKTGEAFGQLVKSQFESATDSVQASVAKATKAAKAK